jgi:hypothetical protein
MNQNEVFVFRHFRHGAVKKISRLGIFTAKTLKIPGKELHTLSPLWHFKRFPSGFSCKG